MIKNNFTQVLFVFIDMSNHQKNLYKADNSADGSLKTPSVMFIEHVMFDAFWRRPKRTDITSCSSGYHI